MDPLVFMSDSHFSLGESNDNHRQIDAGMKEMHQPYEQKGVSFALEPGRANRRAVSTLRIRNVYQRSAGQGFSGPVPHPAIIMFISSRLL